MGETGITIHSYLMGLGHPWFGSQFTWEKEQEELFFHHKYVQRLADNPKWKRPLRQHFSWWPDDPNVCSRLFWQEQVRSVPLSGQKSRCRRTAPSSPGHPSLPVNTSLVPHYRLHSVRVIIPFTWLLSQNCKVSLSICQCPCFLFELSASATCIFCICLLLCSLQ